MKTKNKLTQFILTLVAVTCLWVGVARATDPITLTVTLTNYSGPNIPADFLGLSYEKSAMLFPNVPYFAPNRNDIITSFQNLCLRNLRIGGGTADGTNGAHPTDLEISNLFEFAQSSGVHVIYGLQLLSFTLATNIHESSYILTNSFTAPWLDYLGIGNEPFFYTNPAVWIPAIPGTPYDNRITNINSWIWCWESNADAIVAANPGTTFAGPEENIWGTNFLHNVDHPSEIKLNTEHFYVFEGNNKTADQHVADMLTNYWVAVLYTNQYLNYAAPWVAEGYPYRFTEMNDDPYVANATDAFASALWALDALNWWASNGCAGINFHNNLGNSSDTIVPIDSGHSYIAPKGYAIKAFDLGSHGYSVTTSASNPNKANVDCYAVVAGQDAYVTIVNKQYSGHGGLGGNTAAVTINLNGVTAGSVRAMWLTQTSADVEATNGVTLGSATLTNNMQFVPGWQDLAAVSSGSCTVDVPIAEAAVVDIRNASVYSNPIQVNNNGTLELFSISTNGDVFSRSQLTTHNLDNQGSSPANWGAGMDMGTLASGVTAVDGPVAARNDDGTLEVFAPGSDGNVYDNYQITPGGDWNGWYSIGGPGVTNLQVGINRDGSLNLFGIGNNGDIWNNTETAPHILGTNWMDWGDTAGVQPGIAVGQNLDGRLEVYGVNASGQLYHKWQGGAGSTNWAAWSTLGSGTTLKPDLQVVRDTTGNLYVFGLDASGTNLDYINQTAPGQGWSSWNNNMGALPTGITAIQPGFVMAQDNNGRFEVVSVLTDGSGNNVYHNWLQSNGTWSGWNNSLGGAGTDPHLLTANTEDGRLQIFGNVYTTNDIQSIWQTTPAGGWSSWTDFGSYRWHSWDNPGNGSGFTNGFAACSWGANRMDVFGVSSSDHNIYHNWWNGSAWQSTWELHSLTMAPTNAPAASANVNVGGREDVYYNGADGNLYHQWWTNGSTQWSPWDSASRPTGVMLVGTPSATSWSTNRYDVFARGSDGNVYHVYKVGNQPWSSWESHANNGAAVTNDVASCSWSSNRFDVFTLGRGTGQIYHQYWDGAYHPSRTTWAQDLPETSVLALGASSWGAGRIDLFGNTGSALTHTWYFEGWANWPDTLTTPATPVMSPCSTSWSPGRIDVFMLGSDGKCYHNYYW